MSFLKKIRNSKRFFTNKHNKDTNNSSLNGNLTINVNDSHLNANNGSLVGQNQIQSQTLKSSTSFFSYHNHSEKNARTLIVYHIDSETEGNFSLTVRDNDLGQLVLDRVCDHYGLFDYKEYFGLKYTLVDDNGDHEIFWLDPLKTVAKQLKNTNNVLTFRVKHFPGKPQLIESEYVRYLIYLQIRNYLLKGDLQLSVNEEAKLAAYAVQASLGDYDEEMHKNNYLSELKFLPKKTLKAEETIIEFHKELKLVIFCFFFSIFLKV
jgi:hypothetical protein